MVRRRLALVVATLGALTVGMAALAVEEAEALSRESAAEKALAVLRPHLHPGRAIVFAPRRPLGARDWVIDAIPARGETVQTRRIGRRAWMFWADLRPYERFEHPSRLLLLDARTGTVLRHRRYRWWPVVSGKPPIFVRSPGAYSSRRYRVYSRRLRGPRIPPLPRDVFGRAAGGVFGQSAAGVFGQAAVEVQSKSDRVPIVDRPVAPNLDLSRECVFLLADRVDPQFQGDSLYLRRLFIGTLKLPRRRVFEIGGANQLPVAAATAEALRCDDVIVWITAHGSAALGPKNPHGTKVPTCVLARPSYRVVQQSGATGIQVMAHWETVDSIDLIRTFNMHPKIKFKVIVDACFAGRWLELIDMNRIRDQIPVVVTSVAGDQLSPGPFERIWPTAREVWNLPETLPSPFDFALPTSIATIATDAELVKQAGGDVVGIITAAGKKAKAFLKHYGWKRATPQVRENLRGTVLKDFTVGADAIDHQRPDGTEIRGQGSVTVSWDGGSGRVDSAGTGPETEATPETISCKPRHDESRDYNCQVFKIPHGAKVTLTARPAPGSRFRTWTAYSDPCVSQGAVCTTTQGEPRYSIAVAFFEPVD